MKKKQRDKFKFTKLYSFSFIGFIVMFLFIFASPKLFGENYSYPEAELNEYQSIGSTLRIGMVKKEFNPETGIMRLDLSVENSVDNNELSNVSYEVSSRYISGKTRLETEVKQVNDEYLIVLIKGLPTEFEVLSATLNPYYIHSELQTTNDLEDKTIKFYINEDKDLFNKDLVIETDNVYQDDYLSYKQSQEELLIKEAETKIETNKLKIKETEKIIEELKIDLTYETGEELFNIQNSINSNESQINEVKKEIEELELSINEHYERINLLENRKNAS